MRLTFATPDPPRSVEPDPEDVEIGRTTPTDTGYYMVVSSVTFRPQGTGRVQRIRIALWKDETFVRHLDINTKIAAELWPVLRDSGRLGERKR